MVTSEGMNSVPLSAWIVASWVAPATPTAPSPAVIAIAAMAAWVPARDLLRPLSICLPLRRTPTRPEATKPNRLLPPSERNFVDIRHIAAITSRSRRGNACLGEGEEEEARMAELRGLSALACE